MLSAALSTPPPRGKGHTCTVGFLLVELASLDPTDDPGEEYRAFVGALQNKDWTSMDLERVLATEGHRINIRHLRPHRAGQCTSANCPNPNVGRL